MTKQQHAFPTGSWEYDGHNNVLPYQEPGMTLRDYFAAKAMQATIARVFADESNEAGDIPDLVSRLAYLVADAMLAERAK